MAMVLYPYLTLHITPMPSNSSPTTPDPPASFTLMSVGIFVILAGTFGLTAWLLLTIHSYQTSHGSLAVLGMDQPAPTGGAAVLELLAPSDHLIHQLGATLRPLRSKPWRPTGTLTQLHPTAKITTIDGMPLRAGEYLLLAHCSHEHLRIRQHHNLQIKLKQLTFIPPKLPPHETGTLTIHCDRFHPGMFHQTLTNIYKLYLLHDHQRLFIHTAPYEIAAHHDHDVHLAALKVQAPQLQQPPAEAWSKTFPTEPSSNAPYFFLTRAASTGAIARPLPLNEWTYLLPGTYTITINGTHQTVDLAPGQAHTIPLGQLSVHIPTSIDLKAYAITTGHPFTYELITPAGRHHLYPNTNYMLLSGDYRLRIQGAHHHWPIMIKPHRRTHQALHALTVYNSCDPPQPCAQTTTISLFRGQPTQLILQAPSDVPIFFAHANLTLTTHRSLGLQTPLTLTDAQQKTPTHLHLTLGEVHFLAQTTHHPTKTTELVRIETLGTHHQDEAKPTSPVHYSEDIRRRSTSESTVLLFPGQYQLVAYEAHASPHGFTKRRTELMTFTVRAQQSIRLNYPIYRRNHPANPATPATEGP